jgi:hypothetical protein
MGVVVRIRRGPARLERFRAKWTPVRVKKTRQIKNLELRFDSIETEKLWRRRLMRLEPLRVASSRRNLPAKRFQAKWRPVRVKKTRQIKNLEPRFDSIETEKALASAANLEFALEPNVVVLIRCLLLLPLVLRLSLGWFGRRSLQWAEDDFSLRPRRLLGRRLNWLGVVRRRRPESVPRDRRLGSRRTTVSQGTAIREHQCGKQEYNALHNHRGNFSALPSKTQKAKSDTRAFSMKSKRPRDS